jgi:hypothetical protein
MYCISLAGHNREDKLWQVEDRPAESASEEIVKESQTTRVAGIFQFEERSMKLES